jgi:hypothetical protein
LQRLQDQHIQRPLQDFGAISVALVSRCHDPGM